ncbi:MAG: hypothetical protein ACREAB_11970 [Blastocatellia bacterium]
MKTVNNVLLVITVLCSFALAVLAQQKDKTITKADVLLSKGDPTIHITFESVGRLSPKPTKLIATDSTNQEAQWPITNEGDIQIVRLRLHNNTRWAISFSTDSLYIGPQTTPLRLGDGRGALGLRDGIEVNVRYGIEPETGVEFVKAPGGSVNIIPIEVKLPVINRSDVSSTSWLPSGRSVIFIVPREHLAKNLKVYVPFAYEWETAERDYGTKEPEHRVYFRAADLPKNISEK